MHLEDTHTYTVVTYVTVLLLQSVPTRRVEKVASKFVPNKVKVVRCSAVVDLKSAMCVRVVRCG